MLRRRFLCQAAAGENDDDDRGVDDVSSLLDDWCFSIKFDDDDNEDDLSSVVMCFDLENELPIVRILDGA